MDSKSSHLAPKVLTVAKVLSLALQIPNYQRPYKWRDKHVSQLVNDIIHHQNKCEYRLGAIVVHRDKKDEITSLNIVDGQQRLLTLALIVVALKAQVLNKNITLSDKKLLSSTALTFIEKVNIENEQSIKQLQHNSLLIRQKIASLSDDKIEHLIRFLVHHCTFVYIELNDLSEAFQFFDSQNARGKSLEPYDLLKAYHLREMEHEPEAVKSQLVERWEAEAGDKGLLKPCFDDYLYRIRTWLNNGQARYFNNNDIGCFKGIHPDQNEFPPYFSIHRLAHHYTDNYNADPTRKIDQQISTYPFSLNQVILNGRRFFDYIDHYLQLLNKLPAYEALAPYFKLIAESSGKERTGDKYTYNLFLAVLLTYIDKFGEQQLAEAGKLCFLWAYKLRLDQTAVQLAGMDNYALKNDSLFKVINEAIYTKDVFNFLLVPIDKCVATKVNNIAKVFKDNGLLLNE